MPTKYDNCTAVATGNHEPAESRPSLTLILETTLIACGYGFYWAWLMLSFYADPTAQMNVDNAWLFGSAGHSLALGIIIFGPQKLTSRIARRKTVFICGIAVSAGTAIPFFNWEMVLDSSTFAAFLVCSGWLLTGLGTAVLVVAWGSCFIKLDSKCVLAGNAFSLVGACIVHFLLFSAAFPVFASVMVFLPLISALLLIFVIDLTKRRKGTCTQPSAPIGQRKIKRFSPRTLIPLGSMFFFAFCGELLRSAATTDIGVTNMGLLYDLGLLTGAIAVVVGELVLWRRSEGYRALFNHLRILFMIMAFSFMVSTVLDLSFGFAYLCYAIGFAGLRIYAWIVTIDLAKTLNLNVFKMTAAMILSFSLGPLLASMLEMIIPIEGELWSDISLVLVFGMFVIVTELLNRENYQDAWGLSEDNIISIEDRTENSEGASRNESAIDAERLFNQFGLTPREREVAKLLAAGRSLPYIADTLVISLSTAQTHQRHIYEKAGVHDRQKFLDILNHQFKLVSIDSSDQEKPN